MILAPSSKIILTFLCKICFSEAETDDALITQQSLSLLKVEQFDSQITIDIVTRRAAASVLSQIYRRKIHATDLRYSKASAGKLQH